MSYEADDDLLMDIRQATQTKSHDFEQGSDLQDKYFDWFICPDPIQHGFVKDFLVVLSNLLKEANENQ